MVCQRKNKYSQKHTICTWLSYSHQTWLVQTNACDWPSNVTPNGGLKVSFTYSTVFQVGFHTNIQQTHSSEGWISSILTPKHDQTKSDWISSSLPVNQHSGLEYRHISLRNTSSFRVHFPTSYLRLTPGSRCHQANMMKLVVNYRTKKTRGSFNYHNWGGSCQTMQI